MVGSLVHSSRLSVSFLDSLMGERGVVRPSLALARPPYTLSSPQLVPGGEAGDRGPDLQNLGSSLEELARPAGSEGERGGPRGEEGEGQRDSSLGALSPLMAGGAAPSTDLDLPPPLGEGDLDLRTRLEPKLELCTKNCLNKELELSISTFDLGIWDLSSRFTFWKLDRLEKEKSLVSEHLRELVLSEETAETPVNMKCWANLATPPGAGKRTSHLR